ncbi:OmpA family protein [Variovorax sp. HJSM1_2]|uniref:OmpA family protein n=1 Tax=Variovorax sp. HJSM1_2 TaxID=3366263 RepID=UPI003BE8721A
MNAAIPLPHLPTLRRRALLSTVCVCVGALTLPGCQTAPVAVPQDVRASREAEFKRLGFVQTADGWEYAFTGKILFDTASDVLDPESQATAERIGQALRKLDVTLLRVEGHTDNTGTPAFNQTLSLRRAEAVALALVQQGLPKSEMQIKGWGAERPITDNNTAGSRMQNRRVAVIVPAQ